MIHASRRYSSDVTITVCWPKRNKIILTEIFCQSRFSGPFPPFWAISIINGVSLPGPGGSDGVWAGPAAGSSARCIPRPALSKCINTDTSRWKSAVGSRHMYVYISNLDYLPTPLPTSQRHVRAGGIMCDSISYQIEYLVLRGRILITVLVNVY